MAPIKRKAVTDDRPSKKVKAVESKGEKAMKAASKEKKPKRKSTDGDEKPAPKAKSILLQEERAFPRGGGGVLTPLEHKQIKAQAEQDALFEDEQGGEQADGDLLDDGEATKNKKSKKTRRSGEDIIKNAEGSGVRISGLSYKNLVVGSTVLGRVTAITGKDIALALPNNLTGYAPITSISERLNTRIERLLQNEEKQETESDEDEDIDLKQIFYHGQWLRAVVKSMGTDLGGKGKNKKHIELSLEPGQVNGGLSEDSFATNATLQASVRSVEDHGVVMDLGLSDANVKGFVSKKELGAAFPLDTLQEGQVMLCLVTGKASNGKVFKLSPDATKFSVLGFEPKLPSVTDLPTVDAFLPGTAVDILVTESGPRGVVGKIMGMLDVTADFLHSSSLLIDDMGKRFKLGSKTKARVIFALPKDDGSRRVGISLLGHILGLVPPPAKLPVNATAKLKTESSDLDQPLKLSSFVENAKVTKVLADKGVYLELPSDEKRDQPILAFAHISQLADKHIDTLSASSGPFKSDSTHKARVVSYDPVDNLYYVSLKESVLDQAFLRLEDLPVGDIVKGTIDRLILGPKGVTGVLVKLSDSISGLAPEMHLSDAQLQHPERKFREGLPVKARILSVDLEKRHVRLTLKKSIVEDDAQIWKDYSTLKPGMESKCTIINLLPNGAAVQFFGGVRAWLPVAEMSETFIEKPELHFRLGQTVRVQIVSVDSKTHEMKVTCKTDIEFGSEQQGVWEKITGGDIVEGTVSEKTAESLSLDLDNGLKGIIRIGHLSDRSSTQVEKELKRIRVGQKLSNVLVLDKHDRSKVLILTNKPAIIEDAKAGHLIRSFGDAKEGQKVHGFVRNITPEGVYVEFANGTVALVSKTQLLSDMQSQPDLGVRKDQTITAWVISIDTTKGRFWLSMREQAAPSAPTTKAATGEHVTNAVDSKNKSMSDFALGKVTKARIVAVKATQINVLLADGVQGRIDVSEAFDLWEEIKDKAAPLQQFKQGDVIAVKILGLHDARNHRFLPISHRQGKNPVFELSAKKSRVKEGDESLLSLDTIKPGSSHLAFVNNHGDNCVWVNLSPAVRGRVAFMDLSDDVGKLQNVENRFRIGCSLRIKVKAVDLSTSRLDLTARQIDSAGPLTLKELTPGMVLPARVTKSSERSINVEISENVHGPVFLTELDDDYDQANPAKHKKNDIVRVCVITVDAPNKKISLTLRPSRVLSSSLPVKDPQITEVTQLKPGDTVRGFVKQVADKGVFVSLGLRVDALVRISDLSDQFVKDWKSIYEVDRLVKGRVVAVDPLTKQVQLSLKKSHVDSNYKPPLTIDDLSAGTVVTGKVRKVEDFGAFVDIDNTQPRLSGLCHRSEVASRRVEDVRKLYSAGDVVKAMVLSVDTENRKISLGLKASYFADIDEDEDEDALEVESDDEDVEMADGGVDLGSDDEDVTGGVDLENAQDFESEYDVGDDDGMDIDEPVPRKSGLKTSGFDWNGDALNGDVAYASESEHETTKSKKKKRKPEIKEDLTGELDKYGPKSVSDFERQLLGQPNNSGLWIQYMAFQLELSEVQKAREIAQRALRMINIRETEEKANIWIALLNLEVEYGDDDTVEEVFKEACQVQDSLEMHEKLASIYIDSGKHDKAEAIFERIVGNKAFRANSDIWLNYATFLMNKRDAAEHARALLPKAHKSVPVEASRLLTAKFAALEFTTAAGDIERGRTLFESLMDTYPKWSSGWDMWVDIERSRIAKAESAEAKKEAIETTRKMFERIVGGKFKKRRAKFVFKKWLEFEEKEGSKKQVERVKALAKEYAERLEARGEEDEE